jgi:cyclopropane fatty-acyl-phospholipid synthase-like methyltransferase
MDLGCGWGSVTLFVAERYPKCQITSVSNSSSQREYIEGQCQVRDERRSCHKLHIMYITWSVYVAGMIGQEFVRLEESVRSY